VEVYRFDEEVSIPISQSGSRFRVAPLLGDDSRVRVEVVHLPPDGAIGPHVAPSPQLLAIVAGSGWVSGQDGQRRQIAVGSAALWAAGEEHAAGSDDGFMAVCIEGDFDVLAALVTREIIVGDYNPEWPVWFERVRRHIWPAIEDIALGIDHVGSTSVPGLAAKPIIDIDIVVESGQDIDLVIDRLAAIGYRWRGDFGVPGRQAFTLMRDEGLPRHNLYLVERNNKAHLDHWLLRDLLRQDGDARERYAALKKRNAEVAKDDIDVYVAAKAGLVAELLTRARAERGLPPAAYWEPETGSSS
jgi:GrpB-like predicted nucleotidyltransferase (UPF0157 family)/quercetin dioxygenase-like cupin family protein